MPLEKFLKVYFCLKQVPLSSSQCALLLPKTQKRPFTPRFALVFSSSEVLFPRKAFLISQKCPIVFQNCSLVFQKSFLFIYYMHLFPKSFFSADCTFSLSCSELLREMIFALILFSFLLKLFVDQLMMPSW